MLHEQNHVSSMRIKITKDPISNRHALFRTRRRIKTIKQTGRAANKHVEDQTPAKRRLEPLLAQSAHIVPLREVVLLRTLDPAYLVRLGSFGGVALGGRRIRLGLGLGVGGRRGRLGALGSRSARGGWLGARGSRLGVRSRLGRRCRRLGGRSGRRVAADERSDVGSDLRPRLGLGPDATKESLVTRLVHTRNADQLGGCGSAISSAGDVELGARGIELRSTGRVESEELETHEVFAGLDVRRNRLRPRVALRDELVGCPRERSRVDQACGRDLEPDIARSIKAVAAVPAV